MSDYCIEWRVIRLVDYPTPGVITRIRESINLNTVGVLGAALICGGLAWKHLKKFGGGKEEKKNKLNKLHTGDEDMSCHLRKLTNKVTNDASESIDQDYSNKVLLPTGFVENYEVKEDNIGTYEDIMRDEPDGASDNEEMEGNKRKQIVSCSTFNSIVDASMVDIVKTAKEARAMIRKLSFTTPEDGDGRVKFELGWDEESDDCVASFIRANGNTS